MNNMRVSDMSYRQIKIYQASRRRRRCIQLAIYRMVFVMTLCIISSVAFHSLVSHASSSQRIEPELIYKSVTVYDGDTIDSIAYEYIDVDNYKSVNKYKKEIIELNKLGNSGKDLRIGTKLVIPVYMY